MRKLLVLTLTVPLFLLGATDQEKKREPGVQSPASEYRPCRPGRGDDRCIQLYERGVRASYAQWRQDRRPSERHTQMAMRDPAATAAQPRRHRRAGCGERCQSLRRTGERG